MIAINSSHVFAEMGKSVNPTYYVIRIEGPADLKIEREGQSISTKDSQYGIENDFGRIDLLSFKKGRYMFCLDYYEDYKVTLSAKEKGMLIYTIRWYTQNDELIDERSSTIEIDANTLIYSSVRFVDELSIDIDKNGDKKIDDTIVIGNSNNSSIEKVEFKYDKLYMRVGEKRLMDLTFEPVAPTINNVKLDSSDIEIVSFDDGYFLNALSVGTTVVTFNADGKIAQCSGYLNSAV